MGVRSNALSQHITLRLTPTMNREINNRALANSMSSSDYIRRVLASELYPTASDVEGETLKLDAIIQAQKEQIHLAEVIQQTLIEMTALMIRRTEKPGREPKTQAEARESVYEMVKIAANMVEEFDKGMSGTRDMFNPSEVQTQIKDYEN